MLELKRLVAILFTSFLMISSFLIFSVRADPAAVLKVSLPEGSYVGYDNDPWLSECWLLNLTGASQTFILRINDTSKSVRSYDTHLVIALNDEGYSSLETLIINGTQVPKSAFRYGTPTLYNIWTWPSGDVYPTWFNDTYINVGTIERKGYVDLIVSITVSNATNVRVHFDAYGSRVSPPPPEKVGDIIHNGISEDSTVLLQPGPPPPQPPISSFYYTPQYPETNEIVTFNATESYDPDGYIVSYSWDFCDGTPKVTTSDPITNHTYTAFGDYTVTLTVTDNSGLTGEATSLIHVSQHPVASFTFTPTDPLVHETVTFNASASTPDGGTIVNYTWNFGDGNITTVSDPIITHAYSTYGTYTVTLNVTDSEGKWDATSRSIYVSALPVADFFWTPYWPQRCETVTFDASTSTPDGGAIVSYTWEFGDGTPKVIETTPITTHSYTATGDYIVTLNVTDSEGRWDIEQKTITVVPRRFFLKVNTDPANITSIPGEGWYNESTEVTLTAPDIVLVSAGVRYRFNCWDVDGTLKTGNPITVIIDANHTATAPYILEYYLTVSSPYGITGGEGWYDNGTTAYATLNTNIFDHGNGTRRVFTNWSGDASGTNYAQSNPITMNAPKTAIANWKTQYYLTVSSTYGSPTPTSGWFDAGTQITASVTSPSVGPTGTRYLCTGWTGTGSIPASGTGTSVTFTINQPSSITWNWKTQYLLTVLTDPSGLSPQPTRNPTGEAGPPNSWWYDATTSVAITAQTVTGYNFNYWGVDGNSQGNGVNPISVPMNAPHTATAHYTIAAPPLSVSINPLSASIYVGQSVTFTSTVSGGYPPYSYQWYLNGAPVSGATTSTWTFTPTTSGIHYVYLKVTDANNNVAQSETARITVSTVPVGGYSISLTKQTPPSHVAAYIALIALFGAILSLTKRKRK